jgi:hypothetical protein
MIVGEDRRDTDCRWLRGLGNVDDIPFVMMSFVQYDQILYLGAHAFDVVDILFCTPLAMV